MFDVIYRTRGHNPTVRLIGHPSRSCLTAVVGPATLGWLSLNSGSLFSKAELYARRMHRLAGLRSACVGNVRAHFFVMHRCSMTPIFLPSVIRRSSCRIRAATSSFFPSHQAASVLNQGQTEGDMHPSHHRQYYRGHLPTSLTRETRSSHWSAE